MKTKKYLTISAIWLCITSMFMGGHAFSQQVISSPQNAMLITCNMMDYNFAVTMGYDDQLGCFFDIESMPLWTYTPGGGQICHPEQLPHGLYIELTGATINSTTINNDFILWPGNPWLVGSTQTPVSVSGSNYVYWNRKPEPVGADCSNATSPIPSNQLKTVRVYVQLQSSPVTVTVANLIGAAWPAGWSPPLPIGYIDCGWIFTFSEPVINYSIGPDQDVCANEFLQLTLTPPPPAGSKVYWYKSHTVPCPVFDPDNLGLLWLGPYQGNGLNTNALNLPTCYVAVIQTECYTYVSNIRTITICNGPPNPSISAVPSPPYGNLIDINNLGILHACTNWDGELQLTPTPFPCSTTINWTMHWRYLTTDPWSAWSASLGTTESLQTGLLSTDNCNKIYEFKADLVNACGQGTSTITIIVDKQPSIGDIRTLTPYAPDVGMGPDNLHPIVCKETRLKYNSECGEVAYWESTEETALCSGNYGLWNIIPGSDGTPEWWTNPDPLTKTMQYRVWIENGACFAPPPNTNPLTNGVFSNPITVLVIPDPVVSITANTTLLCPGAVPILTATTNLPPSCMSNVPVAYQWYKNGNPISGANNATYSVTGPGNYWVVFSSVFCEEIVRSNVITICKPLLTINGPCCICPPGETVYLIAEFKYMDPCIGSCNYTYSWSTGDVTQQISITQPGTYSVTVSCGLCTQSGSITVISCP